MNSLSSNHRAALIGAFKLILRERGLDVCASEWGKQLGGGLFEFRVRYSAAEIVGLFNISFSRY